MHRLLLSKLQCNPLCILNILNFFTNSLPVFSRFFLSSLALLVFCFSCLCNPPRIVSHQTAYPWLRTLSESYYYLILPYILLCEALKSALSYFPKTFAHLQKIPIPHKIFCTAFFRSPIGNGNLVSKRGQKSSNFLFKQSFL